MASFDKVASNFIIAFATSDEVQVVAKGCTSVNEGKDTLDNFIEMMKGLLSHLRPPKGYIVLSMGRI